MNRKLVPLIGFGEGKRVKKVITATGDTTVFVFSAGKLVAEYSTEVAPLEAARVSYTTTDHLGSPRVITDQYGQVISRRDFRPFGEDLTINVGARSTNLDYGSTEDNVRQKFTGYQKDTETSLDFAEARMYENRFGRFTAVDPLLASGQSANPQTFNRYVYVDNRPLVLRDPNGLIPEWVYDRNAPEGINRPVWISHDEFMKGGYQEWERTTYTVSIPGETMGDSIVLDRLGPINIDGVGEYAGWSKNGVAQGTGVFGVAVVAGGLANDYNISHAKALGNFGLGIVNAPMDTPIVMGLSGTSAHELFGVPRFVNYFEYSNTSQMALGKGTEGALAAGSILGGAWSASGAFAATKVPTGNYYSVLFQHKVPLELFEKGYYSHFKASNIALEDAMSSSPSFGNLMSKMGVQIPRTANEAIKGESPGNFVWHHDVNPGVIQLVPKGQHTKGSIFWSTLHPNGRGGMAIWGSQ